MTESKTSEKRLRAVDRQLQALELRKTGMGFLAIADKLGYRSVSGAYDAVMAGIKKTLQEPADELRKVEVERLDIMLNAVWWAASHGEPHAIDRVLRIMERKAKYLGLDAPGQYEILLKQEARRVAEATGMSEDAVLAGVQDILAGKL